MRLNQIMISGETRQDPGIGDTQEPALAKSIRLFFRQKLSDKLDKLLAPFFEETAREIFEQEISNMYMEHVPSSKSQIEADHLDNWFVRKIVPSKSPEEIRKDKEKERILEFSKLKKFDRRAYEDLYRNHFPSIARIIISEGGDQQVARDIFQNALIVLLERIRSDDFVLTCSAGTYLHSVSINIWRNLRRKLAQRAIQVDIKDFPNSMTETIYFEEIPGDYEKLAALLEKMEDPCKSLLENFYVRELSWEAIAEKMGYASAGSARNQKYKCIERIRKALEVG